MNRGGVVRLAIPLRTQFADGKNFGGGIGGGGRFAAEARREFWHGFANFLHYEPREDHAALRVEMRVVNLVGEFDRTAR